MNNAPRNAAPEHARISRLAGLLFALGVAFSIFALDQVIKRAVEESMRLGESIPLLPGALHLTYIKNSGGAFGILSGRSQMLLIGSVIAIVVVLWMLLSGAPSRLTALACGLILGGAAGNLLDRLTTGGVTDYVDLRFWPIFNAADTAIVLGVILLLFSSLNSEKNTRKADRQE